MHDLFFLFFFFFEFVSLGLSNYALILFVHVCTNSFMTIYIYTYIHTFRGDVAFLNVSKLVTFLQVEFEGEVARVVERSLLATLDTSWSAFHVGHQALQTTDKTVIVRSAVVQSRLFPVW